MTPFVLLSQRLYSVRTQNYIIRKKLWALSKNILAFHMTSQKWQGVNSKTKHSYQSELIVRFMWWQYMEFRIIIFSLQYSISINTFEVDPPSDSLHNALVKPKNSIPGDVLHDTARWMYGYRSVGLFHIMLKMLYSPKTKEPSFIQTVYLGFISFYVLAKLDCCILIIYVWVKSNRDHPPPPGQPPGIWLTITSV